jgi:hypothetical protein
VVNVLPSLCPEGLMAHVESTKQRILIPAPALAEAAPGRPSAHVVLLRPATGRND